MSLLKLNGNHCKVAGASSSRLGQQDTPCSLSSDSSLLTPSILLAGFSLFLQFLLDSEADFLCGVRRHIQSPDRLNYRLGYYSRKLPTSIGAFSVRVPHLRFFHARTPIAKRAKRLAPEILDTLSRIHAHGVTPSDTSALIKSIWTMELPDPLLAKLTAELTPILQQWRSGTGCQPVDGAAAPSFAVY